MKIAFAGAGRVGSTAAFATLHMVEPDEMVLVDIVADLAVGEAMDLESTAAALGRKTRTAGGSDYGLMKDADVVVVTAGVARKPGMTRLDLVNTNVKILKDVMPKVAQSAPRSVVVMVSNPLDIMVYFGQKFSGLPRERVVGMGSLHDTVRLIGQFRAQGATRVETMVIGEHGDTMFPFKSRTRIEGIPVDWAATTQAVRERGMEVIKRKGATTYTPGTCAALMVRAIVKDEKREMPVSVVLQGEYGIRDVALGVPARLGRGGLDRVVEVALSDEEKRLLAASAEALKKVIADVKM